MGKILILVLLLLVAACHAGDSGQPITFRYVKTGEFNNKGYVSFGTIFWATNHTTNVCVMNLSAIENRVGSNWIVQYRPMQLLLFQPSGKSVAQVQLGPHAAGYATLKLSCQPAGTIWRAEASVAPVLTGLPDKVARIRQYPEMLRSRFQYGDTNIPHNPFATNMTFFVKTTVVFSQEVSEK